MLVLLELFLVGLAAIVFAIPALIALFVVGLPILLLAFAALVVFSVLFGLFAAVIGIGFALFKIAVFIVLPIAFVGWVVVALAGGGRGHARLR